MRYFFAVCLLLNFISFKVCSQDEYFVNDTWENVVKLSKQKKQMLVVFVYAEKKCDLCDELFLKTFGKNDVMERLSSNVIFYKIDITKDNNSTKEFLDLHPVKKPSIFFLDETKKYSHRVEPNVGEFDLEGTYTTISQWFKNKDSKEDLIKQYQKNYNNLEIVTKYLEYNSSTCFNDCIDDVLTKYLKSVSDKEQISKESLSLLIKYQPKVNDFFKDIYLKLLQKAVIDRDLYNQLMIKFYLVADFNIAMFEKKIISKKQLNQTIEIIEECNKITPNFLNIGQRGYKAEYYLSNNDINGFINEAKEFYNSNLVNFDKGEIIKRDSVFNIEIQKFIQDSLSFPLEKREFMNDFKNHFLATYTNNLSSIAKHIYYLKDSTALDFGITCSEKALELSPHANNFAIYGLLLSKTKQYKKSHEMLLKAIELNNNKKGFIYKDIYDETNTTLLEIQKMIPKD